jgi:hypothetical protein
MFFGVALGVSAQETTILSHTGVPQDWSQSHIVFSRDALARHPELMDREPRILHQAMQRWQAPSWESLYGIDPLPMHKKKQSGLTRDWNVPTIGGRLRLNMFPAKYSFDPGAQPDCTNDYVVFALAVAGVTGGEANLVAFNNLYSGDDDGGLCGMPGPTVLFAYNVTTATGGKLLTSPVLSLNGSQIAFVESVPGSPGSAIFHVLTWTAGEGSIGHAAAPSSMTSLTFSTNGQDSTSSPWIDYAADTAYMGATNGVLYQVTPVFDGTPALSGNPGWPALVSNNYNLTAPVLDSGQGLLMVGSVNGNLYQIVTATGAVTPLVVGQAGGTGSAIVAPPIVDVTNGTTFVVSANNGTSAVLVQTDTASLTNTVTAQIGLGGTTGTKLKLFQPAFNNAYFDDPSTGVVSLCGTGPGDTTPWQYVFGFTSATLNPGPVSFQALSTSTTDRCTGWTEFFNPYAGATDAITATSVASDVLTVTANNSDLIVGEDVYIQGTDESFLNGQAVVVASLIGTGPTYTGFTANFVASDYANPTDTGAASTGTDFFFFGLTGDCETLLGGTTTSGCVVALGTNDGTTTATTAAVGGGPSGIVIDNYSTAEQASSIYLTPLTANTAYKFTQEGLQ